jgi:hypothetical protein
MNGEKIVALKGRGFSRAADNGWDWGFSPGGDSNL